MLVSSRSDEGTPPPLALARLSAGALGDAAAGPALGAPDGVYGWGEWELDATLPEGPAAAAVHELPAGVVPRSLVVDLAASLRLEPEPRHLPGGWYVVDGTRELSVSELPGRRWVYADHGCVAGPVFDPQTGVGCAVAEPGGIVTPGSTPTPTPRPVSEDAARRITAPVLAAVGIDPASAVAASTGGGRDVLVPLRFEGTVVLGADTRISVGADGAIRDATGWLGVPTGAVSYPVISAREAFDRLRNQPQPRLADLPCELPPGSTECPAPPARVITGARLGLVLGHDADARALLVPAWLFAVRGQDEPAAVVAIEPRYLAGTPTATPAQVPIPSTPTQVDPAAPPPVRPAQTPAP